MFAWSPGDTGGGLEWGTQWLDGIITDDLYLRTPLCVRDCIIFLECPVPWWLAAPLPARHTAVLTLLLSIYNFIFNSAKFGSLFNWLAVLIGRVKTSMSKQPRPMYLQHVHTLEGTSQCCSCANITFWSGTLHSCLFLVQLLWKKQSWNRRKCQQSLIVPPLLSLDDRRAAPPVVTVCGLPTWGEVHVVLVVAALQGVEGSRDLAGELLAAVHALALQVVAQVGDVVFVSWEEGKS